MYRPLTWSILTKDESQRLKTLLRGYRNLPRTVVFQGAWGAGMTTLARIFERERGAH